MIEKTIVDRVPSYPGRVTLTPVDGKENVFDMVRSDEPIAVGTPINKATLDSIIQSRLTGRFYPCAVEYKAISTSTITSNPVPQTGWTESTITKATNGTDYTVEASSSINSTYKVVNAFDADIETQWASTDGTAHTLTIRFPVALKLKKFKLRMGITGNTSGNKLEIRGSNDGSSWATLHTITTYPLSDVTEYTLAKTGTYEYYQLYFTRSTSSRVYVNTFEVTECEVSVYTSNYTNDQMPIEWHTGQRVSIETLATIKHSVLANTFNGVLVNTVLQPLKHYELTYNGESFDVKEL